MRMVLSTLLITAVLPVHAADETVTLKSVKYEELCKFVVAQKGKVVVVDFWYTTCGPCVKAFPHVVQMHQKGKDQDLVVVSVSLDMIDGAEITLETVKKFLVKQKATMTNFFLDEDVEKWSTKLNSTFAPIVYVFNRAGQIAHKYTEAPKEEHIDALVERLLKDKAPQR